MKTELSFSESKLQIHIKYEEQIELANFIESLNGINNEYANFINFAENHLQSNEIKLYINEIRSGSIITDLMAFSPCLMPFIEHSNTLGDFSRHLLSIITALKQKSSREIFDEKLLNHHSLSNVKDLISPITQDKNGQIIIENLNAAENANINITINYSDAKDIDEKIDEIKSLKPHTSQDFKKNALLIFTQTNGSNPNSNQDKGIIESVWDKPIKIRFSDEDIRSKMLFEEHPYKVAFLVDVNIETLNAKPALYTVIKLHECINVDEL